jgi:two-component system sensor histidine kinase AtoS
MNRPLSIPNVPFLRNRQPSLVEIETLLDYLPQASLLLDLDKGCIVLANAKATELTAFTKEELTKFELVGLLPFLSNHIQDYPHSLSSESYIDKLTTRHKKNMEVRVRLSRLDQEGVWGLVTIEPSELRELDVAEKRRKLERFKDLYSLASAAQIADTQYALKAALDSGCNLTGADIIAVYLVDPNQPGLVRSISQGSPDGLPEIIEADEIDEFLEPITWEPGKRVSNSLFRAARVAGLTYLHASPLVDEEAIIGILVLAAYGGKFSADSISISKILSATITSIIQQNTFKENHFAKEKNMVRALSIGETIKEATQDGIILLSPDLMIEELNPQAETLLGYATSEICGQPVNNVLIGPSNLIPSLQAAQQGISTPNLGEVHLHRRDGVAFLAHISTVPLVIGDDVAGIIVLIRDQSAHEEFEVRNQQLEQRALLGEVTAIFAHEVRNPINNISTGLQLMAMNLPSGDPNQEVISRLHDDCNRLTHLMQSVLTFSRPPESKHQLVNMAELLPMLLERWRPRLARLNVKHEFKSTVENTTITGDPRSLEQVFSNLIGNSVEAMKDSGGMLSIHIRPSHLEGGRQHIEVNVIDDGPGIPNELIDRIFEPFVTTNRNGTGLGLSIAKRIVTAHKGRISVSSIPGGTVFQVVFPISQDDEA